LPYVIGTDQVTLFGKNSPNAASTALTYSFSAASNKLDAMALLFANSFAGSAQTNAQFQEIRFIPTAGSILKFQRLNLINAKMAVKAKSIMKIQNVTLGPGGSVDTENVGAVALSGKYYKGYGSGAQFISDATNVGLHAENITGLIDPNLTAIRDLQEPPPGYVFANVKSEGGITMDPGEIKESALYDKFVMGLNALVRKYLCNPSVAHNIFQAGKFAFLAMEQTVDDNLTGELGIKIQYDIQNDISMYMIGGTNTVSIPCVTEVI